MRKLSLLPLMLLLGGCPPTGPHSPALRMGVIEFYQQPVEVEAPDEAVAGVPIRVTVKTFGGGCVRKSHTEAGVSELVGTVVPWDLDQTLADPDVVCTEELRIFEHTAELTFPAAGEATVRVHGLRQPGMETVTVERPVRVRPAP